MRFDLGTYPPMVNRSKWSLVVLDFPDEICAHCFGRIQHGELFVEMGTTASPYHVRCVRIYPGSWKWFLGKLDALRTKRPDIYGRVIAELAQ